MYTCYGCLYKHPEIEKERDGVVGGNGSNTLRGKSSLASVGCDVERVKRWKEARTLWRREGAVEENVIRVADR